MVIEKPVPLEHPLHAMIYLEGTEDKRELAAGEEHAP